ncbi:L,D-transpeptidase family protein [Nocardioides taihuensis]|uniref:L,D-transpeptidase family protein n=1 Tax=Nocardioides taihuensis TaxID=1835606 RepID=A0ABW0BKD1_9ACTN
MTATAALLLPGVLLLSLLSAPTTATAAPAPAPATAAPAAQTTDTVRLGGVSVRLRPGTTQVVTANHRRGYHATVRFWTRTDSGWTSVLRTRDGRTGYGGLVLATQRVQGSGKTPLGTFRLPFAFGRHAARDAWDPSYRKIRTGDYWVLDNQSDHYNRWRNKARGGFRWRLGASHPNASERLKSFPAQYEYAVATSFNRRQVRHRGGAIFLHVNGSGATAGCVGAPRPFLRRTLRLLDQGSVPVIAIGR